MTLLRKGIEEQVSVQENGRRRKTTKRELMITQVINKAASGNLKALQYLMPQIIEADALTQASREQISTSDFDEKVDLLTQAVTLLDKLGVKLPVPKAAERSVKQRHEAYLKKPIDAWYPRNTRGIKTKSHRFG